MRKHHWIFLSFALLIVLQPYYVGWVKHQYESIFGAISQAQPGLQDPPATPAHCEKLTGDRKRECQKGGTP